MAARKKNKSTPQAIPQETKLCASCGRSFGYQKRWEKTWDSVRYCSSSCRQDKFEKRDQFIEEKILELLQALPRMQTILASDVETAKLSNANKDKEIKNLRERTRRAARRLVASGKLDILQKGRIVDASTAKGEIELRLK